MTINSLIAADVLQYLRGKRMRAEDVLRPGLPKKKIAVVGDALTDIYSHGHIEACQDGCPKFVETWNGAIGGGAFNAHNSLKHAPAASAMFGKEDEGFATPCKVRLVVDGKIIFRYDTLPNVLEESTVQRNRDKTLKEIARASAVYVADYDKGFVTDAFMRQIVEYCATNGIVCVVDPKRDPANCRGAVLKCNEEFAARWKVLSHSPAGVVTRGSTFPTIFYDADSPWEHEFDLQRQWPKGTACANHVGAGDCFGAWLTLGLAHGLKLQEAARLAHAAGRVYVQHPHNRPPWPHEIKKELDPVGGKLTTPEMLGNIRASTAGRVVFANGCFRVPHAGHSWFLHKAKEQGDVLVVGVNSNISAFRCKPGEFCLPVEQRVQLLAAQQAVDWVVVFDQDTPVELIEALRPDILAKGSEYRGKQIPGDALADVWVAPEGPFSGHSGDLIRAIKG